jgi:hypothetical protein
MSQVSKEFNVDVKGILLCRRLDSRAKRAVEELKRKLKNPDDISVFEFELKIDLTL